MYIEPNTSVRLCKNVPLDNTYKNTIYFENAAAQSSFFASKEKKFIPKNTYQRQGIGVIRLEVAADDIYDCNYMCFQNTNFGSKWFYAFITNVEYVNNLVSQITYELDVMQTWMFDYELKPSFVIREHVDLDIPINHRVPENLEMGDYVIDTGITGSGVLGNYSIVVAASFNKSYQPATGNLWGGVYSGLQFHTFDNTVAGAAAANEFIKNAEAVSDGIVAVFMMDKAMVTSAATAEPKSYEVTKNKFTGLKRQDGKPVHNRKLLSYPYNFLRVSNMSGDSMDYKYENFGLAYDQCKFEITGDMTANPSVYLIPVGYDMVTSGSEEVLNYDKRLVLSAYPQLPFATDSFRAWLAQTGTNAATDSLAKTIVGGILIAVGVGGAMYTGGASTALVPLGAGVAGAGTGVTAASILGGSTVAKVGAGIALSGNIGAGLSRLQMGMQAIGRAVAPTKFGMPDTPHGGTSGATTAAALGILDFRFMPVHIRPEYVTIIDDYFDLYGYATNKVKIPNTHSRPHWNFVQTGSCNAVGSVPADHLALIKQIYDTGITFWKNGSEVGDYTLDNTVGG